MGKASEEAMSLGKGESQREKGNHLNTCIHPASNTYSLIYLVISEETFPVECTNLELSLSLSS